MIRTNFCLETLDHRKKPRGLAVIVGWFAGFFLLLGVYIWWDLSRTASKLGKEASSATDRLAVVKADLVQARERSEVLGRKVRHRNSILGLANDRLAWAPLIEKLFTVVPSSIQLSSLRANFVGSERCTIRVAGLTATQRPRLECDKFRLLMVSTLAEAGVNVEGRFVALEDLDEALRLGGETYPQATFVIELSWKNSPHGT